MRKSRRLVYLFQILCGIFLLWTTGVLGGENMWLNTMSPVVYGRALRGSGVEWAEGLSDSFIGSWAPLWLVEKDQVRNAGETYGELYPSESVLDALYAENHPEEKETAGAPEEEVQTVNAPVASGQGIAYTAEMLSDYNFFVNQFYAIDSATYADGLLDARSFIDMDLTMDLEGEEPKVLIYHTHSQESFADSRPGVWEDTVLGIGETLKKELESRYGIQTLHMMDTFDVIDGVEDRNAAYTYAEEGVRKVLEENPSIKVIIDLHRDGVGDDTRLVTEVNGKETAKIMFVNGLCRSSENGPSEYLQNPYLAENLAFSFKVQAKAAQYYPELMRRIFLRSYQYNLHILPRSLLVECGAQTSTVEEANNAMTLLADLLYLVLSGN